MGWVQRSEFNAFWGLGIFQRNNELSFKILHNSKQKRNIQTLTLDAGHAHSRETVNVYRILFSFMLFHFISKQPYGKGIPIDPSLQPPPCKTSGYLSWVGFPVDFKVSQKRTQDPPEGSLRLCPQGEHFNSGSPSWPISLTNIMLPGFQHKKAPPEMPARGQTSSISLLKMPRCVLFVHHRGKTSLPLIQSL